MADRDHGSSQPYRGGGGGNHGRGRSDIYFDDSYHLDSDRRRASYGGYGDEYEYERRDYYDDSRYSNPQSRERGRGNKSKRKKNRPNSSQSDREIELDGNDSDNSTQSEPPFDKREILYSNKPFLESKIESNRDSKTKETGKEERNPSIGNKSIKPVSGVNSKNISNPQADPQKDKQLDKSKSVDTKIPDKVTPNAKPPAKDTSKESTTKKSEISPVQKSLPPNPSKAITVNNPDKKSESTLPDKETAKSNSGTGTPGNVTNIPPPPPSLASAGTPQNVNSVGKPAQRGDLKTGKAVAGTQQQKVNKPNRIVATNQTNSQHPTTDQQNPVSTLEHKPAKVQISNPNTPPRPTLPPSIPLNFLPPAPSDTSKPIRGDKGDLNHGKPVDSKTPQQLPTPTLEPSIPLTLLPPAPSDTSKPIRGNKGYLNPGKPVDSNTPQQLPTPTLEPSIPLTLLPPAPSDTSKPIRGNKGDLNPGKPVDSNTPQQVPTPTLKPSIPLNFLPPAPIDTSKPIRGNKGYLNPGKPVDSNTTQQLPTPTLKPSIPLNFLPPAPSNTSKPIRGGSNTDIGVRLQRIPTDTNVAVTQSLPVDNLSGEDNSETLGTNSILTNPSQKDTPSLLVETDNSPSINSYPSNMSGKDTPDIPAVPTNEDSSERKEELKTELASDKGATLNAKERDKLKEDTIILEQRLKEIQTKEKNQQTFYDKCNKEKTELQGEKEDALQELAQAQKHCKSLESNLQTAKEQAETQAKEKDTFIQKLEDSKARGKELEENNKKLKELQTTNTDLQEKVDKSQETVANLAALKGEMGEKVTQLKQLETELQTSKEDKARIENESKKSIQDLTEQLRAMSEEGTALKGKLSQFEFERAETATRMKSLIDIEFLCKIEECFLGVSRYPPSDLSPGSAERVEWLVASMTSWNAELNTKISDFESLLHEKETEIELSLKELQEINCFLQKQQIRPTQLSSSATNSSARPIDLIQALLAVKDDQLKQFEKLKQSLDIQMEELRQHYNSEGSKNDQLMQDNADLERRVQTLMCEKEELERKNVELENRLSEIHENLENPDYPNGPQSQMNLPDPMSDRNTMNSRPSPIHLGSINTLPFEPSTPPPYSALSTLSHGHRSTLQKAADELSQLKVKVWELEDESSKLREHLTVRSRDSTVPANISPDIEAPFQAVFAANQSNLVKLSECNREKEALYKDLEFLRKRVEELEVSVERHKLSIEVKEVAYKELYEECREWERKSKKCGHMQHEMERMKRQLLRKDAETQECARLRAERLEQQTTLDNLLAELQERKRAELILQKKYQKMQARLEEFHSQARQEFVITPTEPPRIAHAHDIPQPDPHPTSPPIFKPPISSVPLSPPTRQPAKRHPQILYPPSN